MTKSTLLAVLMFASVVSLGQDISVTFTATGAATQIDSVTATNLATNQSVTLPDNETLVLTVNTGISSGSELINMGMVYPNPFSGKATFANFVLKPQTVYLKVQNLMGQAVAQTKSFIQAGENEFTLSVNAAGIYLISLITEQGTVCYKVICNEASETENRIQYNGTASSQYKQPSQTGFKSCQTGYTLGYASGDVILYKCKSGIYTTIVTDSPTASKNYDVEFTVCSDKDGRNYAIVKIGEQSWMTENLAYLPSVNPSSATSITTPYYYVYGYEGSTVASAKGTANYTTYGVLYNWPAALTACPSGWHLPTDEEWKVLEKNQGMSNSDADATGWRNTGTVGGKLKETGTSHWNSPNTGATNSSGFTALPSGLSNSGGFLTLGDYASFWSASEYDASLAWYRVLYGNYDGVLQGNSYCDLGFSVRCLQN